MKKFGYIITKKYLKNKINAHSCNDIGVAVLRIQDPSQIQKKLRKLLKQKQSHGTYEIAADGMTGGHMTNLLTEYKKQSHSPAL